MATLSKSLTRYKLVFFVPPDALQVCKTAIFAAGAGRYPSTSDAVPEGNPSSFNPIPGDSRASEPASAAASFLPFIPGASSSNSAAFSTGDPKSGFVHTDPPVSAPIYSYTECCWMTLGTGQFRPGQGANPHLGTLGELYKDVEARCEVLCCEGGKEGMKGIVEALKRAHPYEVPAYEVYKMEDF